MQEDVRRILKVAAPFAGVALGWYLFMPNFRYMEMSGGDYKSQFLINLRQLQTISQRVHYRLTTPKAERDRREAWWECKNAALEEWGGWTSSDPRYGVIGWRELVTEKCGPSP